jgi:hypothetical protein
MRSISTAVITLYLLLCISPQFFEAAQTQYSNPVEIDFSIFGLAIDDADLQQFLSKLGPAIPFTVESDPDLKCMCFISNRDETLVLLKFKGNHYAGFKLMSQKKQFYKWHFCELSAHVSKSILIDNRLKLGLDKDQVKAILGTPHSGTEDFFKYVYRWQKRSNTGDAEAKYLSDEAVQNDSVQPATVACKVTFSQDRLISIAVSKYPD